VLASCSKHPLTSRITTAFKAQPVLPNGPIRAWRLPSATKRTERTGHSLLIRYQGLVGQWQVVERGQLLERQRLWIIPLQKARTPYIVHR
jgi:hypothetical protein